MYPLSAARLTNGLAGRLTNVGTQKSFNSVSTDTRRLKKGDVYIALRGANFDGEKFYREALKKGAGALVGRKPPRSAATAIQVGDSLKALQSLAMDQRRLFSGPVIAITGSNGKTGVKECLAWLLGDEALATPGNWNNHIGLPLTLLALEPRHRIAVLELGMNHPGELGGLARICRPSVALELNVGDAHIGHFKSRAAVAKAKEELLDGMGSSGIAVINGDDPLVAAMGRRFSGRQISFGVSARNDLRAEKIQDHGARGLQAQLRWQGKTRALRIGMGGRARLYQALAGLAGGLAAGRDLSQMLSRLQGFKALSKGRQQIERHHGVTFILDAYNASPQSMEAALELLELSAPKGRRLALLGEMLELGSASPRLHRALGARARQAGLRALAALGPHAALVAESSFKKDEVAGAAEWLKRNMKAGDWVLLKGSRGMALERVMKHVL